MARKGCPVAALAALTAAPGPVIAATELDYEVMWAQDVAAMFGYHAGAASVAATANLIHSDLKM